MRRLLLVLGFAVTLAAPAVSAAPALSASNSISGIESAFPHYRTRVFGTCVPYFATVTGSLELT